MSRLTDFEAALKKFFVNEYHAIVDALEPLIEKVGHDLGAALPQLAVVALEAATGAKDAGVDAAYEAAKIAVTAKAKEIGIQEATTVALSIRALAVNAVAKVNATNLVNP